MGPQYAGTAGHHRGRSGPYFSIDHSASVGRVAVAGLPYCRSGPGGWCGVPAWVVGLPPGLLCSRLGCCGPASVVTSRPRYIAGGTSVGRREAARRAGAHLTAGSPLPLPRSYLRCRAPTCVAVLPPALLRSHRRCRAHTGVAVLPPASPRSHLRLSIPPAIQRRREAFARVGSICAGGKPVCRWDAVTRSPPEYRRRTALSDGGPGPRRLRERARRPPVRRVWPGRWAGTNRRASGRSRRVGRARP